jgi:signal transduction histidine kinase
MQVDGRYEVDPQWVFGFREPLQQVAETISSYPLIIDDLEVAFLGIGRGLHVGSRPRFSIVVEGQPRLLRPLIKAEAYRIGREALVNAFRHSEASRVELYLQYAPTGLRIAVCDDGKGISAESLHAGCNGLSWMRERAEHMGAKLKVLSHAAGGTEIQIFVPRVIAFECQG